jgi:hypothetical protein
VLNYGSQFSGSLYHYEQCFGLSAEILADGRSATLARYVLESERALEMNLVYLQNFLPSMLPPPQLLLSLC